MTPSTQQDKLHERKGQFDPALYGRESSALAGDGETGASTAAMLAEVAPQREPFRNTLAHPGVSRR